MLSNNLDKVNWCNLSSNPSAINILLNNFDHIETDSLIYNENAMDILCFFIIDWDVLSINSDYIELLEENIDKLNWSLLYENPNVIKILEKNQDKINWYRLSSNHAIFENEQIPII